MEKPHNPHHRRHLSATLSKNFSRVHSFLNRTAYDDAFSAPINPRSQEFSPRFAEYTEIFNSSKASRGSSIPVLDLPPLMDGESVGGVRLDYSSIFGGFDEAKLGISFEDLLPRAMGDTVKDSSLDFRNARRVGSVPTDEDLMCATPTTTNPSNDRQFNTPFNKSGNTSEDESVVDVVTHGFSHVIDSIRDPPEDNKPSHKSYPDDPFEKSVSHSPSHKEEIATENTENKENNENKENPSYENSKYDFMKPGSSRPESSDDDTSQDRFDCCTETFSDDEISIDSAAAASAAAVRKAIEEAGERIRIVKESLKKRNGSGLDSKFDFMLGTDGDDKTAEFHECQQSGETRADPESRGETMDVDLQENDDFRDEITGKCETGDQRRGLKQFYQLMNICKNRAVSLFSDRANNRSFAEDEGGRMPTTVLPTKEGTIENSATLHQIEETPHNPHLNTSCDRMELNEPCEDAEKSGIPEISEQAEEMVGSMEVNIGLLHGEMKSELFLEGEGLATSNGICREDDNGEELLQEEPLVDCWSDSEESFEGESLERKNVEGSDSDEPFAEMDDSSECTEASFMSGIREVKAETMNEIFGRGDIPQTESEFLKTERESCDEPIISGLNTMESCVGSDPRCDDGRFFETDSTVSTGTALSGDMMDATGEEDEAETYEKVEEENSSCDSHDNIGNVSVISCDLDELEEGVNQESCISDDLNRDADFEAGEIEHIQNMQKNEENQNEKAFHQETVDTAAAEEFPSGENAYESDEEASAVDYEEEITDQLGNLQSMNGECETSKETGCCQRGDDTFLLRKTETEEMGQRHDKSRDKSEEMMKKEERKAVEKAMMEARERAYAEAREKAERLAAERANAEYVETINKLIRERLGKAYTYTKSMPAGGEEAKRRSERAAVERATTEARERALQKYLSEKTVSERKQQTERQGSGKVVTSSRGGGTNDERSQGLDTSKNVAASKGNSNFGVKEEFILRNQAKLERHQRTVERVAKALEEKNMRDLLVQKEQAEKNRLADTVGAEVKRWAKGKQGNVRALLSTLQYILGPDSGWHPIPLTDLVTAASVKKAYRKATLFVHPDKLQQRGATVQQKYVCEKVFDLLKDAWNRSRGD